MSRNNANTHVRSFELVEFGIDSPPTTQKPEGPVEPEEFQPLITSEEDVDPVERAQHQAEELIAQAQNELVSAQEEAEGIRHKAGEEGYQKGYQQGLTEGVQASQARITAGLDNLARAVMALDAAKAEVLSAMEGEIVALVQAVVDRIFLTKDAVKPDLVRQVAAESLKRLAEAEIITLRLNPGDMEMIKEFRPELENQMKQLKHLHIEADPQLTPGDVVAESPTCQVDATLNTRRDRIFKLQEETLQQNQPLDLSPIESTSEKPEADWAEDREEAAESGELEDW